MAQYHIKAEKLRKTYDLDMIGKKGHIDEFKMVDPQIVLELMTSCSQLRQRKVIETFFKECFSNVETEIVTKEHDGKKYQVMRVKN
tara:strand:+ start:814 stop:1071 length:258 start_codon:yes stop_codon:yes gene_type:complete